MPRKRRRNRNRPIKVILFIFGTLVFVVVVAGLSFLFLWNRSKKLNEETMFVPQERIEIGEPLPSATPESTPPPGRTAPEQYDLYSDGVYYRLKQNVVSVLFMGIDSKKNEAADSGVAIGTDQADTLLLGVFNADDGSVRILHIPRDTEADVKVLDMTGAYVDTEKKHICLQHAYGDGGKLSCELTCDAVSGLLYGVPVNRYVSMGTDGVVKAVNAVGGVTMTMQDDFSFYSAKMKKGETVKLNGKRALVYIQARRSVKADDTDQGRMKRQLQFMKAFVATLREKVKGNPGIVLSVYEAVKGYIQTDLSLEELMFLANQGLRTELTDEMFLRLPGEVGTEAQPLFHMDEAAAKEIALSLFYEEIPAA